MIRNKTVAENFSRSSGSYEEAAVFQLYAASRLDSYFDKPEYQGFSPKRILELGCGTGFMTEKLIKRFPGAHFDISDISDEMLVVCEKNTEKIREKLSCDAEFIHAGVSECVYKKGYDLVVSGLTFQWVDNLDSELKNIYEKLNPSGLLLFSTLVEPTFQRLKNVFKDLDLIYPGPLLLSEDDLNDFCSVFDSLFSEKELYRELYPNVVAFLKHIQQTGAGNATGKPVRPGDMRKIIRRYSELYKNNDIIADYSFMIFACNKS